VQASIATAAYRLPGYASASVGSAGIGNMKRRASLMFLVTPRTDPENRSEKT
jgi:hypothetical protein